MIYLCYDFIEKFMFYHVNLWLLYYDHYMIKRICEIYIQICTNFQFRTF